MAGCSVRIATLLKVATSPKYELEHPLPISYDNLLQSQRNQFVVQSIFGGHMMIHPRGSVRFSPKKGRCGEAGAPDSAFLRDSPKKE